MHIFKNDWQELLQSEFDQDYYMKLRETLKDEYQSFTIYPDMYDIFEAFHYTSYKDAKVVILGQDPYHGPDQAHGFSFSVKPGVSPPPSLKNIFKELNSDLGIDMPRHGHLVKWAKEGVLLLNTVLTVRAHQANSHRGIGWESFTDSVMQHLNQRTEPIVFILWGRQAQEKGRVINENRHLVLRSPHPSPLSAHRGFFGSRPFSIANQFLVKHGQTPIDWRIPENPV